jgi:hypothetical protein
VKHRRVPRLALHHIDVGMLYAALVSIISFVAERFWQAVPVAAVEGSGHGWEWQGCLCAQGQHHLGKGISATEEEQPEGQLGIGAEKLKLDQKNSNMGS